jgi:hypothetical protein
MKTWLHLGFFISLFLVLSSWAAENFVVTTKQLMIPERGPVETVVMITPANSFSFIPPMHWRFSPSTVERKVVLQAPDLGATLNIRIGDYRTNVAVALPEALRERLTNQYSGIKITREFECFTSSFKGQAFDGQWTVNVTNLVTMRVAYVPVGTEIVEFSLTALPEKFPKYNLLFGNILTSFRVEPSHLKR